MKDDNSGLIFLIATTIILVIHYFFISKLEMHPSLHVLIGISILIILVSPISFIYDKIFK